MPPDDPDETPEGESPNDGDLGTGLPAGDEEGADEEGQVIPDDDPADHETGKRFMVGWQRLLEQYVQLRVTIEDGDVKAGYAPAELLSSLATAVTELLKDVGGNFPPMLFGMVPDGSMSLYFGDPVPEGDQERLALGITESNAARVSEVLEAEEAEEVFAQALRLGAGATSYRDLARLVESNGVRLHWQVRGQPSVELTPDRAAVQVVRLSQEPPVRPRQLTVNGRLYRVIDERKGEQLGTLGIHLFPWSPAPPLWARTVLPSYRSVGVRDSIKEGLIGESVEAVLTVLQPVPGWTLEPNRRPDLVVGAIRRGPGEHSHLGQQLGEEEEPSEDWPVAGAEPQSELSEETHEPLDEYDD